MLALLEEQLFEMGQTDYQQIIEEINIRWAKHERVQGFVHHVPIGKFEKNITITGQLILKNIEALDRLERIATDQKPIVLAFGTGHAYWVIITYLHINKTKFIPTGESLKREFSVQLERYFYD